MYRVINVDNLGKCFGHQSCFIFLNIALSIKVNFGNSFGTYSLCGKVVKVQLCYSSLWIYTCFLNPILSIYALQ